jgi:hypothetical protein
MKRASAGFGTRPTPSPRSHRQATYHSGEFKFSVTTLQTRRVDVGLIDCVAVAGSGRIVADQVAGIGASGNAPDRLNLFGSLNAAIDRNVTPFAAQVGLAVVL